MTDNTQLMFIGGSAIFLIATIVIIYLGSLLEPGPQYPTLKRTKYPRKIS